VGKSGLSTQWSCVREEYLARLSGCFTFSIRRLDVESLQMEVFTLCMNN